MMSFFSSHQRWFDFLFAMTEKEIKVRYKFTVLGFMWIALNPLLQMLVLGFVFQIFIKVPIENYFLFLFAGLLPWNFFSYTVSKNTPIIIYERLLIQKARFPREVIVLSIVFSNLFHFCVALGLLLLFFFFTQPLILSKLLLLVGAVGWLTMVTIGFSLIFAALNVRYRDVNFFVQATMPLWFYVTPIVYSTQLVPEHLRNFLYLNPLTSIIELFQHVLTSTPLPSLQFLLMDLVLSVAVLLGGWWYFQRKSKFFDDWI